MTDLSEYHWYVAIFRSIFAMLDKLVYDLVAGMFNIFNMVAGAEIRTGPTIQSFFNRVQLILGIIVLFKLVISLFSGIVNPAGFVEEKKGFGNVIKRIVITLILIILIVPLNIPEADTVNLSQNNTNSQKTWNTRMNESGILFGTMGEIQSRILRGNVIPKLVLGIDDNERAADISTNNGEDMALLLLKSFIFINMQPGFTDQTDMSHYLCYKNGDLKLENVSMKDVSSMVLLVLSPKEMQDQLNLISPDGIINGSRTARELILDNINAKCDIEWDFHIFYDKGERYFFVYHLFLSTVAGILFLILILSLTIDVAVRVFKLTLLRLISPVAILSYIDPNSEKVFNNWVKAVTSTYLDLFIRIAVISFIMLFISIIPNIDLEFYSQGTAITRIFARIILFFGLLYFAREAPRFITQTLGIDSGEGNGLFSGLGRLRTGAGILGTGLAGIAGGISSGRNGFLASQDAAAANGENRYSRANRARAAITGIGTGIAGGIRTARSYHGANNHRWRTAFDRLNQENDYRLQNAQEGGSVLGRLRTQMERDFTGDSEYSRLRRQEASLNNQIEEARQRQERVNGISNQLRSRIDGFSKLQKYGEEQARKKGANIMDTTNNTSVNYRDWVAAFEEAKSTGQDLKYVDSSGVMQTMSLQEAHQKFDEFREAAGFEYLQHSENYNKGTVDQGVRNLEQEAQYHINPSLSPNQFSSEFKAEYNGLRNNYSEIVNGDGAYSLRTIQSELDNLNTRKQELATQIARERVNARGNDGRIDGR